MKKKKVLLMLLALVVLMASVVLLLTELSSKNEPKKRKTVKQEKAVPLTINTQERQLGKVTIRCDGEVAYEYEGPIEVWRRDGKYLIEVDSFSCSCFDNEVNE